MFCEVFYNYNKRGNGKPFRVRDKIKLFQNMSFSEFTDQGFILFKQEALNHLAAKLSIDNDQESLVEKLKEANEPIYVKLEVYFDAYNAYNKRNEHKLTDYDYSRIISDINAAHSIYMQGLESL